MKFTAKHRILQVLIAAQQGENRYYFFGKPLPIGYVPTGVLHSPGIAGTSARTRISELNKAGFEIQSELISSVGNKPLHDSSGNLTHVYVYRLLTPAGIIDLNNLAVRKGA